MAHEYPSFPANEEQLSLGDKSKYAETPHEARKCETGDQLESHVFDGRYVALCTITIYITSLILTNAHPSDMRFIDQLINAFNELVKMINETMKQTNNRNDFKLKAHTAYASAERLLHELEHRQFKE